MSQVNITNYFSKRKRTEDLNTKSKVFIVGRQNTEVDGLVNKETQVIHHMLRVDTVSSEEPHGECTEKVDDGNKLELAEKLSTPRERTKPKIKKILQGGTKRANIQQSKLVQSDIRKIFSKTPVSDQSLINNASRKDSSISESESSGLMESDSSRIQGPVVFELKGSLSPKKKVKPCLNVVNESEESRNQDNCTENDTKKIKKDTEKNNLSMQKETQGEYGLLTPKKSCDTNTRKAMTIDELRVKLLGSSRIAEVRNALSKINKCDARLKDLEEKRKGLEQKDFDIKHRKEPGKPQLKKFQALEIEVPTSPQKNIYSTPQKVGSSPHTTPTKSPAYQRFASLALPGTEALALPFKYRHIVETFQCVEAVVSLLFKRKETITFKKLKPAVQQMSRRNFTEHHLGQIKRIYPEAYTFHQEKCRNFGSTSKVDQYELIITPILKTKVDGTETCKENTIFTSDCLLQRKRALQNNLLEKVKDYHEEFLQSLDPPMTIPRHQLTRWHPEFDVDNVPDIEPESLPQAPNIEKYSTAKDVLERARNLINCNQRMEKALQTVGEGSSNLGTPITPTKPLNKTSSSPISAMLKGVPKALLEKVRAKQAAKALQAMTRSPAQDHIASQHSRLPELARILRNLYVTEKKSILPLDFALEKVGNSYREKLSRAALEDHIRLLKDTVPGWLEIHYIRKTNYLRLSKNADMSRVIMKLESVLAEKSAR